MKKIIPGILLVAVVAAAFVFLKRANAGAHTSALQLAPAETIFFAHLPDLRRTVQRWPQTGLAQIGQEPEFQAFLAKPRQAPEYQQWQATFAKLVQAEPGEAFVAVTSIDGPQPKFIGGVSYSGRKSAVEALVAEPWAELKRAQPTGKSDVTMQGKTEIETFTANEKTIGAAFCGDWYLVANDLDLLRRTIDAQPHGLGEKSLGANELFKKSTTRLPAEGDSLLFAQLGSLTERLISLLVASGQAPDPQQLEELKRMQAVAWGTKMEGAQVRDSIFLLSPDGKAGAPLGRHAQAFSSLETFFLYSVALPQKVDLSSSSLALSMFVPGFTAMERGLADQGLKWSDLPQAFGPEVGVVSNWAPSAQQASTLLLLDVKDGAFAKRFVDAFTGGLPGVPGWGREESDGVTIYQSPAAGGLVNVTPTLALTERFLVIGFTPTDVTGALARIKSGKETLGKQASYNEIAKSVGSPTTSFAYLDLKTFFERVYGTSRQVIGMSLLFNPTAGKYVDAGKLPNTETISKHLAPSVFSQSATADGVLVESVGTLTIPQVLVTAVGGAVAATFPMIENAISGGLKLDPASLLAPPSAPPALDAPEKEAPAPDQPAPAPAPANPQL